MTTAARARQVKKPVNRGGRRTKPKYVANETETSNAGEGTLPSEQEATNAEQRETMLNKQQEADQVATKPQRLPPSASRKAEAETQRNEDNNVVEPAETPEMTVIKATLQQLASALAEMQPANVSSSSAGNACQQQESRKIREDTDSQQSTEEVAEAKRPAATDAMSESAPEASPASLAMIASTLQQLSNMVSRMQTAPVDEEQKEESSEADEWLRPAQQRDASPFPVQTSYNGQREHAPARDERDRRNERERQDEREHRDELERRDQHERRDDPGRRGRRSRRGLREQHSRRRGGRGRHQGGASPSDDSSSSDQSSGDEDRRRRDRFRASSDTSSSSSSSSSEDERALERRRDRRERHDERVREEPARRRHEQLPRKKSVKDLELPTFTPSPMVSVSTWIDRVDLALKGAEESGRGKWTDRALYFILGNKLMESASTWWVDIDRRLSDRKRTWTYLKKALLRRYGEKLDKSAAEWRVSMRRMMPGETHADFAAGLRAVVGRNKVSERVLLAQFYRCLDKTTKKLVKQRPKPETLEEAIDKATEIDDPMDNVAQGMMNIGQSWATAPSRYVIPMTGTTGATNVIPGISGTGLSLETIGGTSADTDAQPEVEHALFTNPQGVYNVYSGTWEPPPGHIWNGKYWKEPRKSVRKPAAADSGEKEEGKRSAAKLKRKRGRSEYSGDEAADSKQRKVVIAPVMQAAGQRNRNADNNTEASEEPIRKPSAVGRQPGCFRCGKSGHWATTCPTLKCCVWTAWSHGALVP